MCSPLRKQSLQMLLEDDFTGNLHVSFRVRRSRDVSIGTLPESGVIPTVAGMIQEILSFEPELEEASPVRVKREVLHHGDICIPTTRVPEESENVRDIARCEGLLATATVQDGLDI